MTDFPLSKTYKPREGRASQCLNTSLKNVEGSAEAVNFSKPSYKLFQTLWDPNEVITLRVEGRILMG